MKSATQRETRLLVDFGRSSHLDETPLVHHADAIGDRHCLLLVMGDDDEGERKLLLQFHQLELGFAAQLLIERRKRLVQEQETGAFDQRACKRDALALAAGELVRLALAQALELDELQHLRNSGPNIGFCKPLLLESEGDIALDGEMRKQRIALKHHVERPPMGRHACEILPIEQHAPRIGSLEAREHAQQRGLAAARGTKECKELAGKYVE